MTEEVRNFIHRCPVPVSIPILIPGLERHCFVEKRLFGNTLLTGTEGLATTFAQLGHARIAFLGPDAPEDLILQQRLVPTRALPREKTSRLFAGWFSRNAIHGPVGAALEDLPRRPRDHQLRR